MVYFRAWKMPTWSHSLGHHLSSYTLCYFNEVHTTFLCVPWVIWISTMEKLMCVICFVYCFHLHSFSIYSSIERKDKIWPNYTSCTFCVCMWPKYTSVLSLYDPTISLYNCGHNTAGSHMSPVSPLKATDWPSEWPNTCMVLYKLPSCPGYGLIRLHRERKWWCR